MRSITSTHSFFLEAGYISSFLAGLACTPASTAPPPAVAATDQAAQVSSLAAASTFSGDREVVVDLPQWLAYAAFTDEIESWWDHHFSENPYRLSFDARVGGVFAEAFDVAGNGAEHARVIYVRAPHELRFNGPLGMSGHAITLVHTLTFEPLGAAQTRVKLHLEGTGLVTQDDTSAIFAVWQHFLGRYQSYCSARVKHERFIQSPTRDPSRIGLGFFSHSDPGPARNHRHADDFQLHQPAWLHAVTWWGHAETASDGENPPFSGFLLQIHSADIDASPGQLLATTTCSWQLSAPEKTGRRAPNSGPQELRHHCSFPQPIALAGQTRYFLEISAIRLEGSSHAWQWSDGEGSNATSFSRPLDKSQWFSIQDTDSAFELELETTTSFD